MIVHLKDSEIRDYLDIDTVEFPKYVSPLINLANQFAQGTRPRVVGQMSELIQQFAGKNAKEWEDWYLTQKPESVKLATEKIILMIKNLKNTIERIDTEMIQKWVKDLVIIKTFIGLRFQEAILKKGAELKKSSYRLSDTDEEEKGIDGYIGNIPVSIKPESYKIESFLPEQINYKIIFYKKNKNGMDIDYGEILT